MTWTLLIYVLTYSANGGVAVHSIAGYETQKACQEAAAAAPPPLPAMMPQRIAAGCIPGPK